MQGLKNGRLNFRRPGLGVRRKRLVDDSSRHAVTCRAPRAEKPGRSRAYDENLGMEFLH